MVSKNYSISIAKNMAFKKCMVPNKKETSPKVDLSFYHIVLTTFLLYIYT
jgi:hypothetical protein